MSKTALAMPDPEVLPGDQWCSEDQSPPVAGQPVSPTETNAASRSEEGTSRWAAALLSIYADNLDGFERLRIDTEGRLRSIRLDKGGDGTSPEEERLQATCDTLRTLEHGAELELKRALRKHPLGGWVKATVGVGEKQAARLIAAIGDPYWNAAAAADRPRRGPAELWAYCGYHVLHPGHAMPGTQGSTAGVDLLGPDHRRPGHQARTVGANPFDTVDHTTTDTHETGVGGVAPRRQRGQKANWNAIAKMRARLIAESCIKHAHSPYRAVYDRARAKTEGSDLTLLHQHNRALREVAKAVLERPVPRSEASPHERHVGMRTTEANAVVTVAAHRSQRGRRSGFDSRRRFSILAGVARPSTALSPGGEGRTGTAGSTTTSPGSAESGCVASSTVAAPAAPVEPLLRR